MEHREPGRSCHPRRTAFFVLHEPATMQSFPGRISMTHLPRSVLLSRNVPWIDECSSHGANRKSGSKTQRCVCRRRIKHFFGASWSRSHPSSNLFVLTRRVMTHCVRNLPHSLHVARFSPSYLEFRPWRPSPNNLTSGRALF